MILRRRGAGRRPQGGTPQAEPPSAPDWRRRALEGVPMLWLRIDSGLRVVEASDKAVVFFQGPTLPSSLITFTRTLEVEERAREVLDGKSGPWDIEAVNFR